MNTEKNESSTSSILAPAWESTMLTYLLLPGVCAFFLLLLILIVVFRLIKSKGHKSAKYGNRRVGSYFEQSSSTSIYDVINDEGFEPELVGNQRETINVTADLGSPLQVSLPPLRDLQQAHSLGFQHTEFLLCQDLQSRREQDSRNRYSPSHIKATSYGRNVSTLSSLVNYTEDSASSCLYGHSGSLVTDGHQSDAAYLIDEPIYESLDRAWCKNHCRYQTNSGLCDQADFNRPNCCESLYSVGLYDTARQDESQNTGSTEKQQQENKGLTEKQQLDLTDDQYQTPNNSKTLHFNIGEKNIFQASSSDEMKMYDNDEKQTPLARNIVCKLSFFVGSENDQKFSSAKVTHHFYKINTDRLNVKGKVHHWINELEDSCLFISPPNNTTGTSKDFQNHNSDYPLKLEPVSSRSSLLDILACAEKSASILNNVSCETKTTVNGAPHLPLSENVARLSQNAFAKVQKSQSFKGFTMRKKQELTRQLSLGALSLEKYRCLSQKNRQRSVDKLESSRIGARLGPLPPTPSPPKPQPATPSPPTSPPPTPSPPTSPPPAPLRSAPLTLEGRTYQVSGYRICDVSTLTEAPTTNGENRQELDSDVSRPKNPTILPNKPLGTDLTCDENETLASNLHTGMDIEVGKDVTSGSVLSVQQEARHVHGGEDQVNHYYILENETNSSCNG